MIRREFSIPVLNSLVFLHDGGSTDYPKIDGAGGFWRTATCVAVSCMPDCDGATHIVFCDTYTPDAGISLLRDVVLETPSRSIVFDLVDRSAVASFVVDRERTRLRVWTDGHMGTETIVFEFVP